MRVLAISDLHLDFKDNMDALRKMPAFPQDWLITCGDLCTSEAHLRTTLDILVPRFKRVFWVPGNHELWSSAPVAGGPLLRGMAKYRHLVDVCREYDVLTPEDPYVTWTGPGGPCRIVPLFLGYDYSFRPEHVAFEDAVAWAMEDGVLCSDEKLINPEPYESMPAWCRARLGYSLDRLEAIADGTPTVLINHFPLRRDLVRLRRIPRFTIWCGTRETETFHLTYGAKVVVSGHLHMRATDYRDHVRFEEVSLGYPRDWLRDRGVAAYLREILPGPIDPPPKDAGPIWRFR